MGVDNVNVYVFIPVWGFYMVLMYMNLFSCSYWYNVYVFYSYSVFYNLLKIGMHKNNSFFKKVLI